MHDLTKFIHFCLLLLVLTSVQRGHAQDNQKWHILFQDSIQSVVSERVVADYNAHIQAINLYVAQQQSAGFLLCSAEKITYSNDSIFVEIHQGKKEEIKYNIVTGDGADSRWSSHIDAISRGEMDAVSLLIKAGDSGYPFARLSPSETSADSNLLIQTLVFESGPLVKIDSVIIKGDGNINKKLIQKMTGITVGSLYSDAKLKNGDEILRSNPLFELRSPTEVLFRQKGAELFYFLEKKSGNVFNGIIGFQPNAQTDRVTVTGEIQLGLNNNFNRGESFEVHWKKIQEETQELNINGGLPYIAFTNLGLAGSMSLFKQDSSFVQVNSRLAMTAHLNANSFIQGFFERQNGNKLREDVNLQNTGTDYYGLGINWNQTDRLFNPSRGFAIQANAAAGTKEIETDSENEDNKQNQFRAQSQAEVFIPILRKHVFAINLQGTTLQADSLYANELTRSGGISSIRGFDQYSILSTSSLLLRFETRFVLDQNTYASLFYDQMWYENKVGAENTHYTDAPFGFGVGFNFRTSAGIFGLNYALGSEFDQTILVRNGKIHFGFKSLF